MTSERMSKRLLIAGETAMGRARYKGESNSHVARAAATACSKGSSQYARTSTVAGHGKESDCARTSKALALGPAPPDARVTTKIRNGPAGRLVAFHVPSPAVATPDRARNASARPLTR